MTEFIQWSEAEMQALLGIDKSYNVEDLAVEIKTRSGSTVLRSAFDVSEKVAIVRSIYKRKLRTGDFGSAEEVAADVARESK